MQIDTQDFLRLVESARTLCFFDFETTGLQADYGQALVFSYQFGNQKPKTVLHEGRNDRSLVFQARDILNTADCIVSYNGKMFDVPFLNSRLLEYGLDPIEKKHHIDMYFVLKYKIRTGSKSLGHISNWLKLEDKKMSLAPEAWRDRDLPLLRERCESDVRLLWQLYSKTKHLIHEVKRS